LRTLWSCSRICLGRSTFPCSQHTNFTKSIINYRCGAPECDRYWATNPLYFHERTKHIDVLYLTGCARSPTLVSSRSNTSQLLKWSPTHVRKGTRMADAHTDHFRPEDSEALSTGGSEVSQAESLHGTWGKHWFRNDNFAFVHSSFIHSTCLTLPTGSTPTNHSSRTFRFVALLLTLVFMVDILWHLVGSHKRTRPFLVLHEFCAFGLISDSLSSGLSGVDALGALLGPGRRFLKGWAGNRLLRKRPCT
jgi:hypothetical protein